MGILLKYESTDLGLSKTTIDDSATSENSTWSSTKVQNELNKKFNTADIQGSVQESSFPPSSTAVKTALDNYLLKTDAIPKPSISGGATALFTFETAEAGTNSWTATFDCLLNINYKCEINISSSGTQHPYEFSVYLEENASRPVYQDKYKTGSSSSDVYIEMLKATSLYLRKGTTVYIYTANISGTAVAYALS